MSTISTLIAQARAFVTTLRSSIWAIDVRDGIADSIQKLSEAIEQCYSDVSNPTLQTEALEAALQNKIDEGEMAALTIGDHTITAEKLAQGVFDNTLAISGAAADAKKTGDEITALKADLGAQTGVISLIKDYCIKTSDTPIDLTPTPSSVGRMYAVVDCTAGDKFVINAYSNWGDIRAWCFIDSANNAISMAEAQADVTDLELTAPNNAAKLIINDMRGGMSYKVENNLASKIGELEKGGAGLTDAAKEALLNCFQQLAWIMDNGYYYYNNLQRALYNWGENLLYKLINTPVSFIGDEYINTSTVLWDSDYSFTIYVEYIDGTNHFRDTENKMLFREARRTEPWANIYFQSYNGGSIDANTYNVVNAFRFSNGTDILIASWEYSENKNSLSGIINRFVVSYDKDTKKVICGFSHNNTILNPTSESGDFEDFNFIEFNDNAFLIIGGLLNDNTRRFVGVINDFEVYKESITTEKMNNYLMGVVE